MSAKKCCINGCRRGFSQVELLAVLLVIGLLLSLVIPAVQSAREAARKYACINNQRQIGDGLFSYESYHGHFPARGDEKSKDIDMWVISILPHMGHSTLQARIREIQGDFVMGHGDPAWDRIEPQLIKLLLPGFHCPSDPAEPTGTLSYPGNDGIWPVQFGYNGMFRVSNNSSVGFGQGPVRTADVTDGLSNTALLSEWLHGPTTDFPTGEESGFGDYRRWVWYLPLNIGSGAQVETMIDVCRQVPPTSPPRYGWRRHSALGQRWFYYACGFSTYNHAMTPNRASCRPLNGFGFDGGLYTAGSYHTGGINVLYADGHVQFISGSIDMEAWQNLGSRSSGSDLAVY